MATDVPLVHRGQACEITQEPFTSASPKPPGRKDVGPGGRVRAPWATFLCDRSSLKNAPQRSACLASAPNSRDNGRHVESPWSAVSRSPSKADTVEAFAPALGIVPCRLAYGEGKRLGPPPRPAEQDRQQVAVGLVACSIAWIFTKARSLNTNALQYSSCPMIFIEHMICAS